MFKPLIFGNLVADILLFAWSDTCLTSFQNCFGSSMLSARDWSFFLLKDCLFSLSSFWYAHLDLTYICLSSASRVCLYLRNFALHCFLWMKQFRSNQSADFLVPPTFIFLTIHLLAFSRHSTNTLRATLMSTDTQALAWLISAWAEALVSASRNCGTFSLSQTSFF